jgi:hypothetical protein
MILVSICLEVLFRQGADGVVCPIDRGVSWWVGMSGIVGCIAAFTGFIGHRRSRPCSALDNCFQVFDDLLYSSADAAIPMAGP